MHAARGSKRSLGRTDEAPPSSQSSLPLLHRVLTLPLPTRMLPPPPPPRLPPFVCHVVLRWRLEADAEVESGVMGNWVWEVDRLGVAGCCCCCSCSSNVDANSTVLTEAGRPPLRPPTSEDLIIEQNYCSALLKIFYLANTVTSTPSSAPAFWTTSPLLPPPLLLSPCSTPRVRRRSEWPWPTAPRSSSGRGT